MWVSGVPSCMGMHPCLWAKHLHCRHYKRCALCTRPTDEQGCFHKSHSAWPHAPGKS